MFIATRMPLGVEGQGRTEKFKCSFYPCCLSYWNELCPQIGIAPSADIFKKEICPRLKSVFGIHDPIRLSNLTQRRVGHSKLNIDKFKHNSRDTIDPICPSNDSIESTEHFMLLCLRLTFNVGTLSQEFSHYCDYLDISILQMRFWRNFYYSVIKISQMTSTEICSNGLYHAFWKVVHSIEPTATQPPYQVFFRNVLCRWISFVYSANFNVNASVANINLYPMMPVLEVRRWQSCFLDGWLPPFCFSVIPTGVVRAALGGGCPSARRVLSPSPYTCAFPDFQYQLILLPDISCETDIKFFSVFVVFLIYCNYWVVSVFHGGDFDGLVSFLTMIGKLVVFFYSFNWV